MKYLKTYDQIRESLNESSQHINVNGKKIKISDSDLKNKSKIVKLIQKADPKVGGGFDEIDINPTRIRLIPYSGHSGFSYDIINEGTYKKEGWLVKSNEDDTKYIVVHTSDVDNKSNRISEIYKDKKLADKKAAELNKKLRGIDEAISVDTSRYKRSHGKKPRGKGGWAFYLDDPKTSSPVFIPHSMQYSDAVNWAKEKAKKDGKKIVWVAESSDSIGDIMISEGVWSKIMSGVKRGDTGPWSIIATDGRKVVGQKIDIKFKDLIPAHYEGMKEKYPKAKLHIEDAGGGVVWSE